MAERFHVWIIAPRKGRGTVADRARLAAHFAAWPKADRPVVHLVGKAAHPEEPEGARIVDRAAVVAALETLATHTGPRWLWVCADTEADDFDRNLVLDGRGRHVEYLSIDGFWKAVQRAAGGRPLDPLLVCLDACHAEPGAKPEGELLGWFAACAADEKARATDAGGWMTGTLLERLDQAGPTTAADLLQALRKEKGQVGQAFKHGLGDRMAQRRLLTRERGPAPAPPATTLATNPIPAYLASLREDHGHLTTVLGDKLDHDRYVELEMGRDPRDRAGTHDWSGPKRLEQALAPPGARLVVLGDAGAGKSTLARHTVYQHATADGDALPVYLSLPTLADRLSEDWTELVEDVPALALGAALDAGKAVWLLLDGLDELSEKARPDALRAINRWAARAAAGLRVAVFSRPAGFDPVQTPGFQVVRVRPLTADQQQDLLRKWLGSDRDAEALWGAIQAQRGLRDLAPNPLLLSLLVLTWRDEPDQTCLPPGRVRLYGEALRLLLEQMHREVAEKLSAPGAARRVLRHLSFALQQTGDEAWPLDDLTDTLDDLEAGHAGGGALAAAHRFTHRSDAVVRARAKVAAHSEAFLQAVRARTHILRLVDKGGAGTERWQFHHRALRDALAAELLVELHRHDPAAMLEVCAHIGQDGTGRWGETLALAAAAVAEPVALIRAIGERDQDLGRRLVLEADGLPAEAAAELAKDLGDDPEVLRRLVAKWPQLKASLWRRVTADAGLETLADLHYALSAAEWVDDARFFGPDHAARPWQPLGLKFVDVPAGDFLMGSPEGVGDGDEHPQHPVTLSAFAMSATTVTNADFAKLAREADGIRVQGEADHPAVNVSWYVARLFARWAGQRERGGYGLPSEAQWEYACRAGTTTLWHHGDSEAGLADCAWYGESFGSSNPHQVGNKEPNLWGLYDLHGNVWEWCYDWYGDYPTALDSDPLGPKRGANRIRRGGAYWRQAAHCRSASRGRFDPAHRDGGSGFRLVCSAPDTDRSRGT